MADAPTRVWNERLPGTLDLTDPAKPRLARGSDDLDAGRRAIEGGDPRLEFNPISDEVLKKDPPPEIEVRPSAGISTQTPVASDWRVPSELPDLRRAGIIAIDCETNDEGLRADRGSAWPWRGGGYICGVSVAYRADDNIRSLYFPIRHPDTKNFDPEQLHQWLRDHINSDVRFVTQNGLYDWGWLRTEAGIVMPPTERLEEIGALATLIDENRFDYGLDALCNWRGLPGKDETLLHEGIAALGLVANKRKKVNAQAHIWQLPARYVGPYAEADAANTL